jgi:hypothetical protein
MPLKCSSRQVVFINTGSPANRVYLLRNDISNLPDDAEISANNLIARYCKRSQKLENVSLADFAVWYYKVPGNADDDEDDPDSLESGIGNKFQVMPNKRRQPTVIRFVRFSKDDPENYSQHCLPAVTMVCFSLPPAVQLPTAFSASPTFLYTVSGRARFHCDSCASC